MVFLLQMGVETLQSQELEKIHPKRSTSGICYVTIGRLMTLKLFQRTSFCTKIYLHFQSVCKTSQLHVAYMQHVASA